MEDLYHPDYEPTPTPGPGGAGLSQGAVGPEVMNLQRALNFHLPEMLPPLPITGFFGPDTHKRVCKFQDMYDIPPPRGLVGPRTRRALYSFVHIDHHILFVDYNSYEIPIGGRPFIRSNNLAFDDDPQPTPPLPPIPPVPPIPRMPFPFPQPFRLPPWMPPLPNPLATMRSFKIEVEGGNEVKVRTTIGQDPQPPQLQLFLDAKVVVWSAPLAPGVDFTTGGGVMLEKRLFSPERAETGAYFWIKAEVERGKLGPVTIAKLQAEGQIGLGKGPPDMSATVTFGPEVEATVAGRKVTIGLGGYAGITKDDEGFGVTAGGKMSTTLFF